MILLTHSYYLALDDKQLARMKPYPPLATIISAAVLRERGHEVTLFDAMLARGPHEFAIELDRLRPPVVMIIEDSFNFLTKMCTLNMRLAAFSMIAAARARGCRVACSGSDAADHPELYLDAGADVIIIGDPEETVTELADAWHDDDHTAFRNIRGLVWHSAGTVMRSDARPAYRELDALPLPAWDLIDIEKYRAAWTSAHGRFSWNAVTSRGCPFGCNWCAKPVFGRRYAQRNPASVATEMERLKRDVQPDHIWFADDIFGLTPAWMSAFAVEVGKRDACIPFMIQSRADLLVPAAVEALAAAGAEEVWLGVESGSQKILDRMEKGTRVEQIRMATRVLRQNGVRAGWFIQLGYPSEDWNDILLTRDLLREEAPDDVGVSVAYPLPGTKFHASVRDQLGARANWENTDELAMLFEGSYQTAFYRRIRDALHDEVRTHSTADGRWAELALEEMSWRSMRPTLLEVP